MLGSLGYQDEDRFEVGSPREFATPKREGNGCVWGLAQPAVRGWGRETQEGSGWLGMEVLSVQGCGVGMWGPQAEFKGGVGAGRREVMRGLKPWEWVELHREWPGMGQMKKTRERSTGSKGQTAGTGG